MDRRDHAHGGRPRFPSRLGFRATPSLGASVILAATLLATAACSPFDDLMVAVFKRSMRDQPSFDPYENPMPPPEGSVSFSSGNFPAGPGEVNLGQPEGLADPPPPFTPADVLQKSALVMELANPVPPSAESLERGEVVYNRFCAPCHGERGIGKGAYIIEKHLLLGAYDLAGETVRGYADGYIYGIIRVGRGSMPSYGHRISHFDRWHVVNYIRKLRRGSAGEEESSPDPGGEAR